MKVKMKEVAQSGPTLSDPMDCSLPGFSIHEIFQARSGVSLPSPSFLLSFVILINSGDNTFISYVICNCFFSQPVVYFIFLTISLKSISCHFFFFSFVDHAFDVKSKKSLCNSRLQSFLPMFSSESFSFRFYL